MAHVAGEAGVALDALLQRAGHVVERRDETIEIGVVTLAQSGRQITAGDLLRRPADLAERVEDAAGDVDAEPEPEDGRDRGCTDQRGEQASEGVLDLGQ